MWSLANAVGLRYLLVCLFGWLALAAVGLDRLAVLIHRQRAGVLLSMAPLAVVVASSGHLLAGYYTNAYGFHPRWPEAYTYVAANARPGDVIVARHPIVGRYYLQTPDVEHLPLDADGLRELGERVWLITENRGPGGRDIAPWIYAHAEVRKSLELAIPRPISRVEVLLYERGRTDPEAAGELHDPDA
jgi:hypothetical protein